MADGGYDVADYRDIEPLFGTLADADAMIGEAHDLGLRVIVDIVPNHSSDHHRWFQAALAAGPGSPERERYIFRQGPRRRRRARPDRLGVGLRRAGLDPAARRRLVPAPVRTRAAGLRLGEPRGRRGVRGHPAVLAGPRRRRLPDRRRQRAEEGPVLPRRRSGRRERRARAGRGAAPPVLGPGRRARGLPRLAPGRRRVRRRPAVRRRGLGRQPGPARQVRAAGRAAHGVQLQHRARRRGTPRSCARPSTAAGRPPARSARPRPGCSPTTT